MSKNKGQPAFGLPKPGFGSVLKPNNINQQLTNLKPKTVSLRPNPSDLRQGEPLTMTKSQYEPPKKGKKTKSRSGFSSSSDSSYSLDPYVPATFSGEGRGSGSSDSFQGEDNNRVLGVVRNGRSEPVTFSYPGETNLRVMQLEDNYTPSMAAGVATSPFQVMSTPKLTWNYANYSGAFTDDVTTANEVTSHLDVIYNRYSRLVIAKIRSGIISDWTPTNWRKYLVRVCQLLEFYYTVDSILAYEGSDTDPDRNATLLKFKEQYSDFGILTTHDKARAILKNSWFPQEYAKLIRWTFQNYKYGPAYQSGSYRYFPDTVMVSYGEAAFNTSKFIARYNAIIDEITTTVNRNIISLLSNTMPQGIIGKLPDSCNKVTYDRAHYESYVNQAVVWEDTTGSLSAYPNASSGGYTMYCSEVNPSEAGAFPFVLHTTFNATSKLFDIGMLFPFIRKTDQAGFAIAGSVWANRSNKKFAFNSTLGSDNFVESPRNCTNFSEMMPTCDVHTTRFDSGATNFASGSRTTVSMPKGRFQALYFNANESRLLYLREFLNWLFYLT